LEVEVVGSGAVKALVPLRVVAPPSVTGVPWEMAPGSTVGREALLAPLSMRERALVCAVAECLAQFRSRAESTDEEGGLYQLDYCEKQGLLGLMVAFEDATGCKYSEAEW
jgi:hypothetical protein